MNFNDDFSGQIEWTPVSRGGSTFKSHRAVKSNSERIEFKRTFLNFVFPFIFIFLSVFVYFMVFQKLELGAIDTILKVFFGSFSFLFFIVGIGIIYQGSKKIVFDKTEGFYWKGNFNSKLNLEDIYSLQILYKKVTTAQPKRSSSYFSYELNIVMIDRTRVNVIDHGKLDWIRSDAKLLSAFLGVPVWDATLEERY